MKSSKCNLIVEKYILMKQMRTVNHGKRGLQKQYMDIGLY